MESSERYSQMDTRQSILITKISSRRTLRERLFTILQRLKLRSRRIQIVYKCLSLQTTKQKNISQTAQRKLVSLMERSNAFSKTEKKRVFSQMEPSSALRRTESRQQSLQMDSKIFSSPMVHAFVSSPMAESARLIQMGLWKLPPEVELNYYFNI